MVVDLLKSYFVTSSEKKKTAKKVKSWTEEKSFQLFKKAAQPVKLSISDWLPILSFVEVDKPDF